MDSSFVAEDQQKNFYQERASYTAKDELGNRLKAETLDIGLLMLYGHILYAGTSYSYALSKHMLGLLLDVAHANPEDQIIIFARTHWILATL